jgi:hypothetical protein
MAHVAVGYGVALCHPMVGEIQVTVLAAVTPLQEATISVFRQWQLGMEMNRRGDNAAHIAVGSLRLIILSDGSRGNGKIAQLLQSLAGLSLFEAGLLRNACAWNADQS